MVTTLHHVEYARRLRRPGGGLSAGTHGVRRQGRRAHDRAVADIFEEGRPEDVDTALVPGREPRWAASCDGTVRGDTHRDHPRLAGPPLGLGAVPGRGLRLGRAPRVGGPGHRASASRARARHRQCRHLPQGLSPSLLRPYRRVRRPVRGHHLHRLVGDGDGRRDLRALGLPGASLSPHPLVYS